MKLGNRSKECIDHEGNKFNSQIEMCCYWGISSATLIFRLKQGLNLKEALTKKTNRGHITDHTGKEHKSFNDMCNSYDIGRDTVYERLKRGWTLEKALTEPLIRAFKQFECVDYTGKEFDSISSMCTYYKINRTLYNYRLKLGWTQEKALTTPVHKTKNKLEEDKLG